jgi:hypothetical protein
MLFLIFGVNKITLFRFYLKSAEQAKPQLNSTARIRYKYVVLYGLHYRDLDSKKLVSDLKSSLTANDPIPRSYDENYG